METIWGIDFGKKYSGNTVICENKGNIVNFYRPAKDSDTDVYIEMLIKENNPGTIFIDAPLTLPGAFYDKKNYTNYFYRSCDQQLNAMSPMFLGGLTARAIQLKDKIEQQFIDVKETYPKALAKKLNLKTCGYRTGMEFIQLCINKIKETSMIQFDEEAIFTWHHFDALLALLSALRYKNKLHITYGTEEEGLIYI